MTVAGPAAATLRRAPPSASISATSRRSASAAATPRRSTGATSTLRWLGASVLTGITGGALIGASIYIALQGRDDHSRSRRSAPSRRRGPRSRPSDRARRARKGDKLNRSEMVAAAKQGFKAPMTIRAGDREVIKVRQFVRVATNLSLTTGTYATDIPPFNPLRLFAEENGERYVEPTPEVADADVSVVKSDLTLLSVDGERARALGRGRAAILEEERRIAAEAGRRARGSDPGAADAARARCGSRTPSAKRWAMRAITDTPVQRDRGSRRPRERHQLRQGRAARRRAARRGARHRPQEGRDPRNGPARLRRRARTRSARSSTALGARGEGRRPAGGPARRAC